MDNRIKKNICNKCLTDLSSIRKRKRHEEQCREEFEGLCTKCGNQFDNYYNLIRHEAYCTRAPPQKKAKTEPKRGTLLAQSHDSEGILPYETGFSDRLKSFFIRSKHNFDLYSFLLSIKDKIINCLKEALQEHNSIKFNIFVECKLYNHLGEELETAVKTKNIIAVEETNLEDVLNKAFIKLQEELEETQLKKSNWSLFGVDGARLKINKYKPLKGSSYIPLPTNVARKRACINVKSNDLKCFQYAVLAKFVKITPHRVSKYTPDLLQRYDFSNITFPTPLHEIRKFEKKNNISINVFGLDKKQNVYPLKICKQELGDHRDLLLINKDNVQHYIYIQNFERLIHSQLTRNTGKIVTCKRCFTHFYLKHDGKRKLQEHLELCNNNKPVRIELPTDKPYIKFENMERGTRIHFVVYADFESILHPIEHDLQLTVNRKTIPYQKHEAMSFCLYVKTTDDVANIPSNIPKKPYLYRGKDVAEQFIKCIKTIAEEVSKIYKLNAPMIPLTQEEQTLFESANECFMCGEAFQLDDKKVHDHCHLTGKFRGAAHNSCNLKVRNPKFLPVFFHNLSGYDSHYIVKNLGYDNKEIFVIPNTEEKYISFSKKVNDDFSIRFLDTYRFMPASLDSLVRNLPTFRELERFYNEEEIKLLTRKGVFPYDYITSFDKLQVTTLPSIEEFSNKLTCSSITEEDYEHAKKVWSVFKCKNLGDYSDHYLKSDVIFLSVIFENFRDVTMKTHFLDPAHYYTLPGLSWDAMLRLTHVELELLQDYSMILMVEKGIRGGICQVSQRHCKANNKYLQDYDPNLDSTFISYQDCNNLYGNSMIKPLPYAEFTWISPKEVNLENIEENSDYGYILDVDLAYPKELHQLHNDLPFLPEVIKINKQTKLVPHLNDRNNYIVHYVALKQALRHGIILKKINRVLKFRQREFLRPFIEYNTNLRASASNNFEKDLYKLYNNSVYGKTMENLRNRRNIKLVCDAKKLEKLISKPTFIDRTLYGENLAAVHMAKTVIKFVKPIYIGLSVLDLAKHTMYEYHYEVMLPKYGPEKLSLAYMDTDSFIYFIRTNCIFQDMLAMLDYLDTSDYPNDHLCFSTKNKKKLGKFKDEACGRIITEFVGLKAKMYAIRFEDNFKEILKAKGIQNSALKKIIQYKDYLKCLQTKCVMTTPVNNIKSIKHDMFTVKINKISLSPHDDKRIIDANGINTKAIGFKE